MERLDFASVMAVLRRNTSEDRCPNQVELVYALFRDFCEEQTDTEFDNAKSADGSMGLATHLFRIILPVLQILALEETHKGV